MRSLLLLAALLPTAGCWSLSYLGKQGLGQLQLLRARRPIVEVLADHRVPESTRRRLRLAVEARDFGVTVLGLRGGDAYTRFLDTGGAPVAWNVSAAPKDRLVPHLYRFPITGVVPYLGFFDERDARREEARLRGLDLDTWVRPVAGYSTLGIFSDPVYSSMLEGSDAAVVEVVLHEMLHGTVFLPGHAEWNESLATFVGLHGAAAFFRARGEVGAAAGLFTAAQQRQDDEIAFSRWLSPLLAELRALYAGPISRQEKIAGREAVFARGQEEFRRRFPARPGSRFARGRLNNAILVATGVYHAASDEWAHLLRRLGGDLAALVRLCRGAVERERDPLAYLRRL